MSETKNNGYLPKEKLSAKEKREKQRAEAAANKKKTRRIVVAVVVILVLLVAVSLLINSNFIRRHFTAITVGDKKFTVAEFNVVYFSYFYNYYNDMLATYPDYASDLLPNINLPLKSQIYDEETGETWADRIESYALASLDEYVAWYNEAQSVGFKLPEDKREEMQSEIDQLDSSAAYYGLTVERYLQNMYGKGVNYSIFADVLEFIYIAEAYDAYYSDSLTYTEEEIRAQYELKRDMYDLYEYRYMIVDAESVSKSDYAADEEDKYNADLDAAMAVAEVEAKELFAKIKTEDDFIKVAKEYNPEKYGDEDSTLRRYNGAVLGSTYGTWLRDEARKEGDTYMVGVSSRVGYYLVYFKERTDNHYETVNVNMIQIDPEKIDKADYADEEDDTAYDKAVEDARVAAKTEAEELLAKWKDEGGTAELFEQYIEENSDNLQDDGIYENVWKEQFDPAIDSWIYDPARQVGDTTVVYNEEDGCYAVLYFNGVGDYYNYSLAETDLHQADYDAHLEEITEGIEHRTNWLFALTKV